MHLKDDDLIEIRQASLCRAIAKEAESVKSWLDLPISESNQVSDICSEASSTSNSDTTKSVGQTCRRWMEKPSNIDDYMSLEIDECCKHGVNVSYQKSGMDSTFVPLFQM
jgi:hypothetical protein